MSKNTLAFPHQPAFTANGDFILYGDTGMTMRQYYKAAALTGLLAHSELGQEPHATLARLAGEQADAMLREDEEHAKK